MVFGLKMGFILKYKSFLSIFERKKYLIKVAKVQNKAFEYISYCIRTYYNPI